MSVGTLNLTWSKDGGTVQVAGTFNQWKPEPMDKGENGWTFNKEVTRLYTLFFMRDFN